MPTTVAIIHPRELLRAGLLATLKADQSIRVVGQGASGRDASRLVKQHRVNVLLLYDHLEDEDSFVLARRLLGSFPKLQVVMIGVEANPTSMARSLAAGIHQYVTEGSTGRQICDAIKDAASGKSPSASSPFGSLARALAVRDRNPAVNLPPRELQTLRHVAYGLSNQEIANCMGISVETVKEHVQNILRKLGAGDRTQAAVWAIEKGLV